MEGAINKPPMQPVSVLRSGIEWPIMAHDGTATSIVGAATGSMHRSINRILFEPGGETIPIRHAGEAVYIVVEGIGELRITGGDVFALRRRSIAYLPHGIQYTIAARTAMTVVGGPCPPDGVAADPPSNSGTVKIFDAERDGPTVPMISKLARLVVWPGVGAKVASMNYVVLEPGEENEPHAHADSDDTIVILEGRGTILNLELGQALTFVAGDVVHVLAGVRHKVMADQGVRIVSAGGPCPPDQAMLRAIGLLD